MKIILVILLIILFLQDFKSRQYYWFLLPGIVVSSFLIAEEVNWIACFQNVLFILFLLISLTIYVVIRTGKLVLITKDHFAIGDALFLLAVVPLYSFNQFLWFVTVGTLCCLLTHMIIQFIRKSNTIPFAGYMALYVAITLLTNDLFF